MSSSCCCSSSSSLSIHTCGGSRLPNSSLTSSSSSSPIPLPMSLPMRMPIPVPLPPASTSSGSDSSNFSSSPIASSMTSSQSSLGSSIISLRSSSPSISSQNSSILSSLFSVFPFSLSPPLSSATSSPSLTATEFHYHSSGTDDDFLLIDQQEGPTGDGDRDRDTDEEYDDDGEELGRSMSNDVFIDHEYDRTKFEGKMSLSWLEQEARENGMLAKQSPRSPPLLSSKPTLIPTCNPIHIPSSASCSLPKTSSSSLFTRSDSLSSSAPSDPTPLFTTLLNKKAAEANNNRPNAIPTSSASIPASTSPVSISIPAVRTSSPSPMFTTKHVNNKKKNRKANKQINGDRDRLNRDEAVYWSGTTATGDLMTFEHAKGKTNRNGRVRA